MAAMGSKSVAAGLGEDCVKTTQHRWKTAIAAILASGGKQRLAIFGIGRSDKFSAISPLRGNAHRRRIMAKP